MEKEVLSKLGIPTVDLEKVGCPKFDIMNRVTTVGSVGHHADPLRHHCPKVECYHFMQLLRKTRHLTYDFHVVNLESLAFAVTCIYFYFAVSILLSLPFEFITHHVVTTAPPFPRDTSAILN